MFNHEWRELTRKIKFFFAGRDLLAAWGVSNPHGHVDHNGEDTGGTIRFRSEVSAGQDNGWLRRLKPPVYYILKSLTSLRRMRSY